MAFRHGRSGFDEWAELFCTETRDVAKSNPGRGIKYGCRRFGNGLQVFFGEYCIGEVAVGTKKLKSPVLHAFTRITWA